MRSDPAGRAQSPGPSRFDAKNFALGAVVSSILVSLLGYVPLAVLTAVIPPDPLERGRTVHGLSLAILGCLLAIFLGAGFTARRARRRAGDPLFEGFGAGFVGGFLFAIPADGCAFLVVIGQPCSLVIGVLPLLLLFGIWAALAGAVLGARGESSSRNQGRSR